MAVPTALIGVLFAAEYLKFASLARASASVARARSGPTVRVSRVLLRGRFKRRIGNVFATMAQRCGQRDELATPIRLMHQGKSGTLAASIIRN